MDATYASTADYVKIHILGFEAVDGPGEREKSRGGRFVSVRPHCWGRLSHSSAWGGVRVAAAAVMVGRQKGKLGRSTASSEAGRCCRGKTL